MMAMRGVRGIRAFLPADIALRRYISAKHGLGVAKPGDRLNLTCVSAAASIQRKVAAARSKTYDLPHRHRAADLIGPGDGQAAGSVVE
jgi:hypothetical protein